MRFRFGLVFLCLFIAADVVLIALAFRNPQPSPAPGRASVQRVQSPKSAATPQDKRRSKPAAPTSSGPLYMVTKGQLVVSASHGACSGRGSAAIVQVSKDGGASFEGVKVSSGLEQVLGLELAPGGKLLLTGTVGDCQVRLFRSSNGTAWHAQSGSTTWHLPPTSDRTVIAPAGQPWPTPCRPTALSTVGGGAVRVLCDDSRVLGRSATGWVVLGRLAGARTIAYPSPARGLAIAPSHGCPSAVFGTFDGGSTWRKAICLGDSTAAGIAGEGNRIIARAGDRVLVSRDGGNTWAREF